MIRIQIPSDHNDTAFQIQQWRKCQTTNPWSGITSWDTNRSTPIQFSNTLCKYTTHNTNSIPKQYKKTTHVITHNRNITTTRLVFIRLRFHAFSLRLLLGPWHSKDPEPKIHLLLLVSKPQFRHAFCPWWLPTSSTHHIPPTILTETVEEKRSYWHSPSHSAWPWCLSHPGRIRIDAHRSSACRRGRPRSLIWSVRIAADFSQ